MSLFREEVMRNKPFHRAAQKHTILFGRGEEIKCICNKMPVNGLITPFDASTSAQTVKLAFKQSCLITDVGGKWLGLIMQEQTISKDFLKRIARARSSCFRYMN
jgi:hypothetical protein